MTGRYTCLTRDRLGTNFQLNLKAQVTKFRFLTRSADRTLLLFGSQRRRRLFCARGSSSAPAMEADDRTTPLLHASPSPPPPPRSSYEEIVPLLQPYEPDQAPAGQNRRLVSLDVFRGLTIAVRARLSFLPVCLFLIARSIPASAFDCVGYVESFLTF